MEKKQPSQLTDAELVAEVGHLATSERRVTADLVAHLAEMEARRLYLRAGFRSLFAYCVEVLHLSEGGAYNRIEAARLAQRFPAVLDLLAQGLLNLGTLRLLGPHLTLENRDKLFSAAAGKSKRDVQRILATMFPLPDVAASIRKLPTPSSDVSASPEPSLSMPLGRPAARESGGTAMTARASGGSEQTSLPHGQDRPLVGGGDAVCVPEVAPVSSPVLRSGAVPSCHPIVLPLSADRYQFRFTASEATREKFRRAQDLLRHAVPNGDPGEIFDRGLTALLKELERKKFAASDRPRVGRDSKPAVRPDGETRTIPAAVKRAAWERDGGRCAYVGDTGQRCTATAFLEFHHVIPYARGGPPTVENIRLLCQAHNGYEAQLDYGRHELVPGRVRRSAGAQQQGGTAVKGPGPGMTG
jgi:hypothetical protein